MFVSERSDVAWEKYGSLDPYFGVYNNEQYKTENLDASALETFFRAGEENVSSLLKDVREHLDSDFKPSRTLDFGCGVGRLTIPLAEICSRVVGVDVAPSMLEEAQRNLRDRAISHVDLVVADDRLSKVTGTFDFLVSFDVFQHIVPRRGETILRAMISRLEEDGIGALRLTYWRKTSRIRRTVDWMRKHVPFVNNLWNLAQKRPFFYPMMQWNNYNIAMIHSLLHAQGCGQIHAQLVGRENGHCDVILLFQKKRPTGNRPLTRHCRSC
jgi:SAM-dependent methyltransferase